jgi:hypothetical protein
MRILVLLLLIPFRAFAQVPPPPPPTPPAAEVEQGPRAKLVGVQFTIPSGGGPTLGLTYFLTDSGALHVDLGLDLELSGGAKSGFSIEGDYRLFVWKHGNLAPFIQPGIFFGHSTPTTVAVEGALGAEYFVLPHLSIGVATGVALNFTSTPGTGGAAATNVAKIVSGTTNAFAELLW